MSDAPDVTAVLGEDFTGVNFLLAKVASIPSEAPALRRIWYFRLKGAISRHIYSEETVLRAALQGSHGPDAEAGAACGDHAMLSQLLWHLDSLPADESGWDTLIDELRDRWVHHHLETEASLFVKLRDLFDEAELRELGERLREAAAAFLPEDAEAAGAQMVV